MGISLTKDKTVPQRITVQSKSAESDDEDDEEPSPTSASFAVSSFASAGSPKNASSTPSSSSDRYQQSQRKGAASMLQSAQNNSSGKLKNRTIIFSRPASTYSYASSGSSNAYSVASSAIPGTPSSSSASAASPANHWASPRSANAHNNHHSASSSSAPLAASSHSSNAYVPPLPASRQQNPAYSSAAAVPRHSAHNIMFNSLGEQSDDDEEDDTISSNASSDPSSSPLSSPALSRTQFGQQQYQQQQQQQQQNVQFNSKHYHPSPLSPVIQQSPSAIPYSPSLPKSPSSPAISWQKGDLLGQGAFGRVYLGLNRNTGEFLAVKEVTFYGTLDDIKMQIDSLQKEINVMKTLNHPNIVRYLGVERCDKTLNILLEFVPAGSLSSLLAKFGKLSEQVTRLYTRQILEGLEYLHQRKVIHRDIKGANILMETSGRLKLADFGAAKQIADIMTISEGFKSLKGTPYWMAPEVIMQTGHGRAADIWSVACTVLEMLTGKPPWAEFHSQVAALFHIANSRDPPEIPASLSPEGRDFLLRCFARDPKQRPSASQLLQHPFVSSAFRPQSILPSAVPSPLSPSSVSSSGSSPSPIMSKFTSHRPAHITADFSMNSVSSSVHSSPVSPASASASASPAFYSADAAQSTIRHVDPDWFEKEKEKQQAHQSQPQSQDEESINQFLFSQSRTASLKAITRDMSQSLDEFSKSNGGKLPPATAAVISSSSSSASASSASASSSAPKIATLSKSPVLASVPAPKPAAKMTPMGFWGDDDDDDDDEDDDDSDESDDERERQMIQQKRAELIQQQQQQKAKAPIIEEKHEQEEYEDVEVREDDDDDDFAEAARIAKHPLKRSSIISVSSFSIPSAAASSSQSSMSSSYKLSPAFAESLRSDGGSGDILAEDFVNNANGNQRLEWERELQDELKKQRAAKLLQQQNHNNSKDPHKQAW